MFYVQMNDYNFVNQYTLEKLEEILPTSQALYIAGTTMVTIPDVPQRVPLKLLCDRVMNLTENRSGWTQAQEKTAAIVCKQLAGFDREGYYQYAQGLPCCLIPFCFSDIGFLCCNCPPISVMEMTNRGNELTRKLLDQDPNIFKRKADEPDIFTDS